MTNSEPVRRPPSLVDPIFPLAKLAGERPEPPRWFDDALQIKPERSFYVVDGVEIELLTWGKIGNPGLLFGHGYAGHADWWGFVAPFFAEQYRCASFSLSGMGRSGHRPDHRYSTAAWAREMESAVAAASLDASGTPPVIVAQSMAGLVAARLLASNGSFGGLIAIDSGFNLSDTPERDNTLIIQGHRNRLFSTVADALARYRLSPDQDCANLYVLDHLARLSLRERDGGWSWHLDPKMVTEFNQYWRKEELRQLPCPVSYIFGERSSLVAHRIDELKDSFAPSTKFIGIPDADHNVLADQPIALIVAIRAVLESWRTCAPRPR
ncbi:alpha/beta fold hydrolase [Rhizorhapis sp. SPR117]|uniref:alpha/beta fold hydrolase n=1 Tax=Rhizorhapis sp. SPR117 TaxID=2912611 RepID=UPI001F29E0AB|nr:alpha/beta hydrolase [Rhizorhapis sp. SPR117]